MNFDTLLLNIPDLLEKFYRTSSKAYSPTACMNIAYDVSGTAHCYDNARMESFFAML